MPTALIEPTNKITGRRRKMTPDLFDEVLQKVAEGNWVKDAAPACGVGASTVWNWIARQPEEAELRESLKKAERCRNVIIREDAIQAVHSAFTKDWRAAMTWLERNFPEEYSLSQNFRVEKKDEKRAHQSSEDFSEKVKRSPAFRKQAIKLMKDAGLEFIEPASPD